MSDDTRTDQGRELEEMTFGKFIRLLPAKHVWALVIVLGGLIGGAFALGYKASSWQSSITVGGLTEEIERLKKNEIEPLKRDKRQLEQDKEQLKAKENVQRKFLLYQLAEAKRETASIRLQRAESVLMDITGLKRPKSVERHAPETLRREYEAARAEYDARLEELYAGLDGDVKRSVDTIKKAEQEYNDAKSEYHAKANDLSATIHFYYSEERGRLGFELIGAVRGVDGLATVTFFCDGTELRVWNDILWPTAP